MAELHDGCGRETAVNLVSAGSLYVSTSRRFGAEIFLRRWDVLVQYISVQRQLGTKAARTELSAHRYLDRDHSNIFPYCYNRKNNSQHHVETQKIKKIIHIHYVKYNKINLQQVKLLNRENDEISPKYLGAETSWRVGTKASQRQNVLALKLQGGKMSRCLTALVSKTSWR